jgi:uncharacterized membrane protein YtjA (UPF0391 family)
MSYLAVGFFVVAVGLMVLDFVGITPGAGGLSNVALLVSLIFVVLKGMSSLHHHWRELHPVSRR